VRGGQLARVLRLIQLLSNRPGGLTLEEMADKGGTSVRTAYRDIDVLEQAGFPVYPDKVGGQSRWKLSEGFRTRLAVPFELDEVVALYLAREGLARVTGGVLGRKLASAFDKVAATLERRFRQRLDGERAAFTVDGGPLRARSAEAVLDCVRQAIAQRESLSIVYKSPQRKRASRRLVDPYRLHAVGGALYVVAWCHRREAMRTFLLDRIKLAGASGRAFVEDHAAEAAEVYSDAFATFDGAAERVVLRFEPEAVPYLYERHWHPSQAIEPEQHGRALLHLRVHPGPDLEAWLRSWGRLVEVLEPAGLRRRLANELLAAAGRYDRRRRHGRAAPRGDKRLAAKQAARRRDRTGDDGDGASGRTGRSGGGSRTRGREGRSVGDAESSGGDGRAGGGSAARGREGRSVGGAESSGSKGRSGGGPDAAGGGAGHGRGQPIKPDVVYILQEARDGAYEPIILTPAGGDTDACWWTKDLTGMRLAQAPVRLEDGSVAMVDVIDSSDGLFISHRQWSEANRPIEQR
jgi:predicted DNA-binding transcriptional regulator YafY